MSDRKPKIGISLRIVNAENYDEKRDAISQDWPQFFEKLDMIPVFIPNVLADVDSYLDSVGVDGIILSGGDSVGDHPERDRTEDALIRYGIDHDLPILGVCRGMQMINHFFGGSILKDSSADHVGKPHEINILNSTLSKRLDSKAITVNSFHNNTIKDENLGKDLVAFAKTTLDGTIEGFYHKNHKILGVMWHPEREHTPNNELILRQTFCDKDFWSDMS